MNSKQSKAYAIGLILGLFLQVRAS